MSNLKIIPAKDIYDSQKIIKNTPHLPNIPFSFGICGKSAISGKTTIVLNLIARPEFFGNDFQGENIIIVSKSLNTDQKLKNLIKFKEIPPENLINGYDENIIQAIVDFIKERYEEETANKQKPTQSLIIFDDMSFNMDLKNDRGVLGEIICNGRHFMLSSIFTAQRITQLSPTIRTNLRACILFKQNNKDLDLITDDFCYCNKKEFQKIFKDSTKDKHDFFFINLENPYNQMYQKNFQILEYK